MLVYTKEPMGYTTIGSKRIYGEAFNYGRFGPTEISYDEFLKHKEILKEVPITSEWLSEKFGKDFPDISFTFTDLFTQITFDELVEVAKLLGIKYTKSRNVTNSQKRALRKGVIRVLDESNK